MGAVSLRSVEDLDQSQKSDVSGRYSRNGRDGLIAGFLPGAAMSLTRHVLADGISGSEAERKDNHHFQHVPATQTT